MYDNTSKTDITMLFIALWRGLSQAGKTSIFEENKVFPKLMDLITDGITDPSNTLRSLNCCL